ncbi:hypothetical protein PoMZ_02260 [Pyricularia oryzae]|uniref:Uncharacterized protein n=1 Tax=Pyricularia oryzae TaxID=318829 RepID=A0A4P7N8N1_PYROR|nr:hypothetical protein PoMZ_02260 [Pyricularia oryzae]
MDESAEVRLTIAPCIIEKWLPGMCLMVILLPSRYSSQRLGPKSTLLSRRKRACPEGPGVGGKVADAILAPDGHDLGALVLGDRLGCVVGEGRDRGGKADGCEPGVQGLGEGLNGHGARSVDDDHVLDLVAGLDELVDNLKGDDTTGGPASKAVGSDGLAALHLFDELGRHAVDTAVVLLGGLHEGREETPDGVVGTDVAHLGVRGGAAASVGYHEEVAGGGLVATMQQHRCGLAVRHGVEDLGGAGWLVDGGRHLRWGNRGGRWARLDLLRLGSLGLGGGSLGGRALWGSRDDAQSTLDVLERRVGDKEVRGDIHASLLPEGAQDLKTHERVHTQAGQVGGGDDLLNVHAHLGGNGVADSLLELVGVSSSSLAVHLLTLDRGSVALVSRGGDVRLRVHVTRDGRAAAGAVLHGAPGALELSKEGLESTNGRVVDKGVRVDAQVHVLTNATTDSKRHQRIDTQISEGNVVSKLVVADTDLLGEDVEHLRDDRGELLVDLADVLGGDALALLLGGGGLLLLGSRLGSGSRSSAGGGGNGSSSTRGQHHVEDLAGDGLELQVTAHADDLLAVKDVDVTSVDLVTLDGLHADVAAVLLGGNRELREPERAPSVGDEDLLARVDSVGSVDDEARDVAQTVDPVGAEDVVAIGLGGLELDLSSSLASLAVEDDLLHTAVAGSVVDQGGEQLVSQATADLGCLAILLRVNETVNARLDEVRDAVEFALPVLSVAKVDLAVGVVNTLGTLASVEDQVSAVLGSIGSDCEPQDVALSSVVEDEGLGNLHVSDVDTNVLRLGTEQLVGILTSSDGHVSIQRRRAERSTVDQVTGNDATKVLAGQVGLDLDNGDITLDLLADNLLHGGRLELGLGDGSSSRQGLGDAVLAETPVSLVLEPVVLLVESIRGEIQVPDGREEVVVVLVPVNVQTSSVESAETGAQGLVSGLVAAKSGDSDGRDAESSLDHVGADGVGADLEPDSLLIDGAGRLGRNKPAKEVNSITSMIAQVLGVDGLIVNELAKEGRDDGDLGGVEADRAGQLLKVIKDGVDLGRVEGEGHLELSALEASGTKLLGDLSHLRSLTTENSLAGSVDASNVGRVGALSKSLLNSGDGSHDSQHGVGAGSALLNEKLGTSTNEVDGVAGRQDTGNVESSVLAQAVAHDRSRLDTPRSPELGQGHLEAAETKLDDEGLELGDIRLAAVDQRHEAREAVDLRDPVELVDGLAEDSVVGVQLLSKTSVVRALASEHEGNLGRLGGDGNKVLLQAVLEGLLSLTQILSSHVHAPVVLDATSGGGIGNVRDGSVIVVIHELDEPLGVVDHGRLGLASDGDHVDVAGVLSRRLNGRSILKQQTGVTTSSAEVVDENPAGLAIRPLEGGQVESNIDVALTKVLGEGLVDDGSLLDTDVGRNGVLLEHEKNLAQSRDTRCGLTVTQVGLDGTEVQGSVSRSLPVGRSKDVGD